MCVQATASAVALAKQGLQSRGAGECMRHLVEGLEGLPALKVDGDAGQVHQVRGEGGVVVGVEPRPGGLACTASER